MSDKSGGEPESVGFLPLLVTFLDIQDVENMCRLCMATKESNSSLCMVEITSVHPNTSTPISQLFLDGLSVDIHDASSEGMPNMVCVDCLTELHSYTNFKKRSLSVDGKLREIVAKKRKVAEAQALYGPVFFDLESSNQYPDNSSITSLHLESNHEAQPDLCLSASQREDTEVETLDILAIQHSKIHPHPELEASVSGEISVDNGFPPNCSVSVPSGRETQSEEGSSHQDCSGEPNDSQEVEGNIIVTEERTDFANNNENKMLSNGIQEIPSLQEVTCPVEVGETVRTDAHLGCAATDLQRCSPEINLLEITSAQVDLTQLEMNAPGCDNRYPSTHREIEITLVSRDACSPQKTKKKQRGKRDSVPMPEVLVIEDAHYEKRLAFRCTLCQNVFDSRILFRKHVVTHFKDRGVVCKHCEKWFKNRSTLARHERSHSGEKPFICVLCDRTFSQKEILQRHILTHTDIKPFQCQKCDKSYTQKEGLANHMKYYHKSRKEILQYPCPLCDKAFCHPSGLSRHMITHTGKQYNCNICNRKFTDTSSLRRHSRSQHPQESSQ